VTAAAVALGASAALAASSVPLSVRHALLTGAVAAGLAAFALHDARRAPPPSGSVRMGIVPWGVLVHADEAPRVLRWAAVRRIEVVTSPARGLGGLSWGWSGGWSSTVSSRVVVETDHDRFTGSAIGAAPLERLIQHLGAYAEEQATPIALDLEGARAAEMLEPECEPLFGAARSWLETARAAVELDLPSAGYRRAAACASSPRAVEVLRRILRDRRPRAADPRAFAAVISAEVHASELAPDLVALTQCPHPLVAAVAKQAAIRLGVPRVRVGALDEVSPFLFEGDAARLEAWGSATRRG
jgi:hypothetical protein